MNFPVSSRPASLWRPSITVWLYSNDHANGHSRYWKVRNWTQFCCLIVFAIFQNPREIYAPWQLTCHLGFGRNLRKMASCIARRAIAEALLCEGIREKRPLFLRDGADLSHTWKINAITSHRYLEALGFSRNGSDSRINQQYISRMDDEDHISIFLHPPSTYCFIPQCKSQ